MVEARSPGTTDDTSEVVGNSMHELAKRLFPICRSLTGNGVRETFAILQEHLPALQVFEVPSGTQSFDWTVPPEWNIRDAYVLDPEGRKIIDFKANNLHVLGYSEPVDQVLGLDELQKHLYSLPEMPDAIPYVTSYYKQRWGFCLTHRQREQLRDGAYRVVIDSTLAPGSLTYGELIIPGEEAAEVFLSTYICHPSLANNELSGPVVATFLARWLLTLPQRRFTYRLVFIPETIGSITYLSKHVAHLRKHTVAGFNLTCIGDERTYSYLPSRAGDTLSDELALHVLEHTAPGFKRYAFLDRGSDERQYCAPGVDLPIATIMRSKYGTYPEYHTSLDNLSFVTPAGLAGGYTALKLCLEVLEANHTYKATILCEPQMGKRGLYSTLGTRKDDETTRIRMNILAYCDGQHSLLALARVLGLPAWQIAPLVTELADHGLIEKVPSQN